MVYLNENDLNDIGVNWSETIDTIEKAVVCLSELDFAQPIKPYLRYRDLKNRIIAMPAFVGGEVNTSGIKWIASFPNNIDQGIARAHSVVILNDANTGEPKGIINTALLSIIRTSSVSGLMVKYYEKVKELSNVKVGMTGFGPIGRYHMKMIMSLLGDKLSEMLIYDIRDCDKSNLTDEEKQKVTFVKSWEEAYKDADIFMSCTVSNAPYINMKPKPGSLHLNVSLRDYTADVFDWFKNAIIVDDWEEVCREKTDIEVLHIEKGLQAEDTKSIVDVVNNCASEYDTEQAIMFNPMGMAVFDIAIGEYYMNKSKELKLGTKL